MVKLENIDPSGSGKSTTVWCMYIYVPYERRLQNCTEILKMEEKTAGKMI